MKKIILSAALCIAVATSACADDDKPIQFSQLPQTAQQFVKQYFGNEKVALAKMESDFFGKNYDIIFANGDKVEFDGAGNWEEVKCRYSEVPLALVPQQILQYVRNTYPDTKVVKLEKKRNGHEVKLSNGWELEFNRNFELIDMDN